MALPTKYQTNERAPILITKYRRLSLVFTTKSVAQQSKNLKKKSITRFWQNILTSNTLFRKQGILTDQKYLESHQMTLSQLV